MKRPTKRPTTKIAQSRKTLVLRRKIAGKIQVGALHPFRFSTLLYDFARFRTLLNAMLTGRPLNKPSRAPEATGSLLEFLTAAYGSVAKGGSHRCPNVGEPGPRARA
jgi:hypothetical protein